MRIAGPWIWPRRSRDGSTSSASTPSGDRANRETLDLFEHAFAANPDKQDLRWRIEHAQHLHPDDIPRFGRLAVIASMQGIHCTSDAVFAPARLGPRRSEEGPTCGVSNGTDAPVGSSFFPDQRMSRERAARASSSSRRTWPGWW